MVAVPLIVLPTNLPWKLPEAGPAVHRPTNLFLTIVPLRVTGGQKPDGEVPCTLGPFCLLKIIVTASASASVRLVPTYVPTTLGIFVAPFTNPAGALSGATSENIDDTERNRRSSRVSNRG